MSISTVSNRISAEKAVRLVNVSKAYQLQGAAKARGGLFGGRGGPVKTKLALDRVSLEIARGERIGLLGRNGAGKTTLLKLIAGNHQPTKGHLEVNGDVQALMSIGYGFHPDQSGLANLKNSLKFNGLEAADMAAAIDDVIDFCELGDYIDEPFKTYSLGMQSRLMFAAATAIRPDILIVDEVLGAGDAYFTAKSKLRVQRLVDSGCTMILVSHSMGQILELCDRAVWLDDGRVRMAGECFEVVKAYEEFMHGPIHRLLNAGAPKSSGADVAATTAERGTGEKIQLQTPAFLPHQAPATVVAASDEQRDTFDAVARGGISRWDGDPGPKVTGFSVRSEWGEPGVIAAFQPAVFTIFLRMEQAGDYRCTYGIAVHDMMGQAVTRIWSPTDVFTAGEGEYRRVDITLNPNQIGPGEYTVGVSILEESSLEMLNTAKRYDLLGRSFQLKVELPESLNAISGAFFHTAEWAFGPVRGEASASSKRPHDAKVGA